MESKKILKFCSEKGFLLDGEVLNLFSGIDDLDSLELVIEKIKNYTQQRIITKNLFNENKEQVNQFFSTLPKESQKSLEKLKIKLGLSIEISREQDVLYNLPQIKQEEVVDIAKKGKTITVKTKKTS